MTFAWIAFEIAEEELRRQKILKESPKGFHLDRNGYTCPICRSSASEENSWYDQYGLKCMSCQKAINKKIIPESVAKNKESWYSKYDLEMYFNIKGVVLNKYIKQGILRDRVLTFKN